MEGNATISLRGVELGRVFYRLQGIQHVWKADTVDGESSFLPLRTDLAGDIRLFDPAQMPKEFGAGHFKLRLEDDRSVGIILTEGWNPFGRYSVLGDDSDDE
jgi:hypothetical protein